MSLLDTKEGRNELQNALGYIAAMGDRLALWYAENKPWLLLDYDRSPAAIIDLCDPAKLAELIAEEGRRLGLIIECVKHIEHMLYFLIGPRRDSARNWLNREPFACTAPCARGILAKWLQLPDGAWNDARPVLLNTQYADPDELLNTIPAREPLQDRRFDPDPDRESEG